MARYFYGDEGGVVRNDYKRATKTKRRFWFDHWESWHMYGRKGNDTLIGGEEDDYIRGEEGNDYLDGRNDHDQLDGGSGRDTMVGGSGNDLFIVDSASDVIYEYSGGGTDTVSSYAYSYTLANHVEKLYLQSGSSAGGSSGTARIGYGNNYSNTIVGNNFGNNLYGLGGNDRIEGKAGGDWIDGGTGSDTMIGGADNDYYYLDRASDVITEFSGGGRDTALVSFSGYRLANNVENLMMQNSAGYGSAYGNGLSNDVSGNNFGNKLYGGSGHDDIEGYRGNDELYGESGTDTLRGGNGEDDLFGGTGSDQLYGGADNDFLQGYGYGSSSSQYDSLYGEGGADLFALGIAYSSFYTGGGYGVIRDFSRAEGDKIQIHGDFGEYTLTTNQNTHGSSALDTHLYLNGNLIGIVADNTGLVANDFQTALVIVD